MTLLAALLAMPAHLPRMILLVGNLDRAEFWALRPALEARAPCLVAESPDQAIGLLQEARRGRFPGNAEPEWIVLAQAYPGQFPAGDVHRLRLMAPLAPVVVVEGIWSAGQWRSGPFLTGVHRVSWLEFARKFPGQWDRYRRGEAGRAEWMLPPTASDEERILVAAQMPLPRGSGPAVIWAARFDSYQWISAICRHAGLATVWCRPGQALRLDGHWAAVFDGDESASAGGQWPELRRLAASVQGGPVVVLLGQPRPEDWRCARAAGATAILNKPVAIDQLLAALHARDALDAQAAPPAARDVR